MIERIPAGTSSRCAISSLTSTCSTKSWCNLSSAKFMQNCSYELTRSISNPKSCEHTRSGVDDRAGATDDASDG